MHRSTIRRRVRIPLSILAAAAVLIAASVAPAEAATAPPGSVKLYAAGVNLPSGIAAGMDGNLWYGAIFGGTIGRITPAGVVTTFTDPQNEVNGARSFVQGTVDSKMWFVSAGNNRVGNIVVTSAFGGTVGDIHTFTNAAIDAPTDITEGGDGNLWFSHDGGIGRVTPGGTITNFQPPALAGGTDQVATDTDGNVWFTDFDDDLVGRVDVGTTSVATFAVPGNMGDPFGLTTDPAGRIWYDSMASGRVGIVTTAGAFAQSFAIPANVRADGEMVAGADGDIYFESSTNRIGRITTDGVVSSYFTSSKISTATGITLGPDGRIWLTSAFNSKVGHFSPDGDQRPDALLGLAQAGPFKGGNAYSAIVGDTVQTQSRSVTRGGTTELWLQVQNDGTETDSFLVTADESGASGITFKYFTNDTNISTLVRGSGVTIASLSPGATALLRIKVKASTSSSAGQSLTADLRVRSLTDSSVRDVVRARATRA